MSKNKLFLFESEMEGLKGSTYRIVSGVRSMTLNGAVRKLYQTMPKILEASRKFYRRYRP